MGGGIGAGAGIDKEPSPRRAAIEKAQAELRQEVAVREERRRELEFLEKGGNPLDFKFGDISAASLQLLSPTDPLAEQNFTSEAKGGFGLIAWPNGDSGESGGRLGSILGRGSNTGSNLLLFAGDTEAVESEGNIAQAGQTSQLDGNQIDSHRKESEDSGAVRLGMKGQAYARRNRSRSNRFNEHSSLRDTDKGGAVSLSMKGPVDVKEAQVETLADKNRNISLSTIAKAISLNRTAMPKSSSCKEHVGNDPDAMQKQDTFGAIRKTTIEENHPVIKTSEISEQVRRHEHSAEVGFNPVVMPRNAMKMVAAGEVENHDFSLVNGSMAAKKSACIVQKEKEQSVNDGHSGSRNEDEKSLRIALEGSHRSFHTTLDAVGVISASEAISEHAQERHTIDESAENVRTSTTNQTPQNTNLETEKETIAPNNTDLHTRERANSLLGDKCLGISDVKARIEEVLPEIGVVMQVQGGKISSVQDAEVKDLSPQSQEGKIDSHSGGITSLQNAVTYSLARVSSSFGGSSNKYPAGVLLEKKKDPKITVVLEGQKANLSEAAKKAHEDIILEEAEVIKAALKRSTEWARRKPFTEPSSGKSHWDFVLEEMAWMANDFMQERLWKMTAAAQVCRWIAQERRQTDFHLNELHRKQKKVAHILATAVLKYWQSVEVLICKDMSVANLQQDSNTSSRSHQNLNNGEPVPMEIDQSNTIELHKRELEAGNMVSKRISVHKYAIRFITDTKGFGGLIQTDAPSTTERALDAGILEPLWEDKFPEESLFYSVPHGAMEAYRNSVESYCASPETEHMAVLGETDAQIVSEGSDEALGFSEYGVAGFVDETHSELSPRERGFCGDDEDTGIQYLPSAFEGSKAAIFGRKKRKKIMKTSIPKTFDGRVPRGACHWFSGGNDAENDSVVPSPLITGKRPSCSGNLNVGAIPTKRIRSSSVAARRAAGTPNVGAAIVSGLANKADVSSGDTSSQQEVFNTSGAVSQPRKTAEADSTGMCGNHLIFDGVDMSFKFKKKKKSKPFGAVISSITKHTGGNSGQSGKGSESEHMCQQNVISQHEQREQTKRRLDSNSLICDTSLGALGATSELQLSNSHGFVGQHAAKKHKPSKHVSDTTPEVAANMTNHIPSPGVSQMNYMSNTNKFIRQIVGRDRSRKNKTLKAAPCQIGPGIPWSTIEDQALVVLVHDVGPNWELVSDIISASLQIKGIFRKPKDCKEHHKCLMERTAGDGGDSPEDSGSSQPCPSSLSGIPKGSARMLLQCLQGPMEEDTLKTHLERIVQVGQQHRRRKIQSDSQEQKQRSQVHASHVIAISQLCSNSPSGRLLTPLDLCDETPANTEMLPHGYPLHGSHASGLAMANTLGTASAMQPSSAGITLLQGTKNNMQLGTCLLASSVGLNAAGAARDVQRFPSVRPSVTMDEQQQHMQQYNRMVAGRSLQPSGASVSSGLSITGLSSSNDCGVPMLPAGNGAGIICGMSRGMSLPRSGFPGIGSPGISGMVSSGISNVIPSSGLGLPMSGAGASGTIHVQGNLIRRPRDTQVLRPGQEQRQVLMQELQLQASQSNGQTAASFSSVNNVFSNPMVSSPNQTLSGQQQHHQKQQQPQGHGGQHYSQSQNPNHNQAYMQTVRQLQQQQQNRYLQPQQQFPANGSLLSPLPQSQLHPLSHTQHSMPSQPHILSQDHQQQPILSQHGLQQQQTTAQQQSTSQSPPILQQSPLQQCGASPVNSSLLQNPSQQQQQSLTQTSGSNSQAAGQSKSQQQNQIQKQQQQAKVPKGLGRDVILLQNPSAQPGQVNGLVAVPGNPLPTQLQAQQAVHPVPGQRIFPTSGLLHLGKQMPQPVTAGKQSQVQGHGAGHESVNLSQISTSLCQQQKGFSQQSLSKQQTFQVASQQQIPSASATNHQVPAASPPSTQQLHLSAPEQQASSVPLLASSSQQQQRSAHAQQIGQRRLLQRQTSSNVGLQSSPQLGNDCMQQQSQVTSQPGHGTFQLGSNAVSSLNIASTSSVVPLSSALNSSTTAVHSAPWKAGQNISQITGGLYNLSRSSSGASIGQTSPVSSSSGMSVSLSNGNTVVQTTTTTSLLSHGVNMAGLPQQQSGSPISPVQEHKVGAIPAAGARVAQQMGAKRSPQQPQLQHQQQHIHNEMQSSIASSLGISHPRPPLSGSMISAVGAGIGIRSQYQGSSMSMTGHSVSGPMPMYNSVQLRQAHAGNLHGQGATSHIPIGSSSPRLISADIPGVSAGLDSVLAITSISMVTMPSTSSQQ